ncbi:MAG: hypothetical protein ABIN97_11360 [Ginsengibacter sp.]
MRHIIIIISILLVSTNLFSQTPKNRGRISSWRDTTFITVALKDTSVDNKIVAVNIGLKATIYVKLTPLINEAKEKLSNDFVKDEYKKIIHFLNSASVKGDTIFIDDYYNLDHFETLISHQLIDGNAKIYYKKQKAFVDTISHRLERFGGNADRFFYLPDKRPFFAATEYTGILVQSEELGKGHFDTYVKEGEKLQSITKE